MRVIVAEGNTPRNLPRLVALALPPVAPEAVVAPPAAVAAADPLMEMVGEAAQADRVDQNLPRKGHLVVPLGDRRGAVGILATRTPWVSRLPKQ